ncbi:MAG: 23S rRNA (uracil(1939)-C(5))-methyltransferase RlmD [Candidatus Cloacimonetes bacterium 4572_65]|nr:MAG: 23S rRNA (uracil(1939)-C(5))-methyltransferase RlmD [Candidatus Cloacimonetes bacterium 4572_65]
MTQQVVLSALEERFLTFAYPGDVLNVRVISDKKDYCRGAIDEIVSSKVKRIKDVCPSFTQCGGCNWLDIDYSLQKELKTSIVKEIFYGHEELVSDMVGSPEQFAYRNKVYFPVAQVAGKINYGLFKASSHSVISAKDCVLVPEVFKDIAQSICDYLVAAKETVYNERTRKGNIRHIGVRVNKSGDLVVTLVCKKRKLAFTNMLVKTLRENFPKIVGIIQNINKSDSNKIVGDEEKILFGEDFFYDEIGTKKYKINYRSFFQVNRAMTEVIYNEMSQDLSQGSRLFDAYSGVGSIGIFLAEQTKSVLCVENNRFAVKDARINAELNKCENMEFLCSDVEAIFGDVLNKYKLDTIIFDPPRKGLDDSIRGLVIGSRIKKILYLSCNPTTQVRDVKDFIKSGFEIKKIIPYDMFPNTYHIENYIVLERK